MPSEFSFFNLTHNQFQDEIFEELKNGLWKQYDIHAHLKNSYVPSDKPDQQHRVLSDFVVIPPGTRYDVQKGRLVPDLYTAQRVPIDKQRLFNLFEKYFSQFADRRIAVHLSGGLDSSIIIGLLEAFKIPFSLVGLTSDRFEFRTERQVQERLAPLGKTTTLIDMEDYPSYSNLKNKPLTNIPDSNIKQMEASTAVAQACSEVADVVFTGQGGDTLFVDAIPNSSVPWSCNINNEFILPFEAAHIYPEHGLELISPFADHEIINAIYSLRIGQKADARKWWARHFFKEILPHELAAFDYSADFFGTSLSGLQLAREDFFDILETAYEITEHPTFSPPSVKRFLASDVLSFEYQSYISFTTKLSLAVWYHSLKREGYVK